jgi:hypothetical protein
LKRSGKRAGSSDFNLPLISRWNDKETPATFYRYV